MTAYTICGGTVEDGMNELHNRVKALPDAGPFWGARVEKILEMIVDYLEPAEDADGGDWLAECEAGWGAGIGETREWLWARRYGDRLIAAAKERDELRERLARWTVNPKWGAAGLIDDFRARVDALTAERDEWRSQWRIVDGERRACNADIERLTNERDDALARLNIFREALDNYNQVETS